MFMTKHLYFQFSFSRMREMEKEPKFGKPRCIMCLVLHNIKRQQNGHQNGTIERDN